MVRAAGSDTLVLGWVDLPFAEGCSVCGLADFMVLLYDSPKLAHALLEFLTEVVIDFCRAQLEAGAPMIGAGDAAASLVSPKLYRELALPYERRVVEAVHEREAVKRVRLAAQAGARYMLSAGCEVPATVPDEVFEAFCRAPRRA